MDRLDDVLFVAVSVLPGPDTEIERGMVGDGIAVIHIRQYPVDVTVHVDQPFLRRLIDACAGLEVTMAEREGATCPT